jgi:hypothetical protein
MLKEHPMTDETNSGSRPMTDETNSGSQHALAAATMQRSVNMLDTPLPDDSSWAAQRELADKTISALQQFGTNSLIANQPSLGVALVELHDALSTYEETGRNDARDEWGAALRKFLMHGLRAAQGLPAVSSSEFAMLERITELSERVKDLERDSLHRMRTGESTDEAVKSLREEAGQLVRRARESEELLHTARSELQEHVRQVITRFEADREKLVAHFVDQSTAAIDQLRKKQSEAADIVTLISSSGIVSEYGAEARTQKALADRWRWGAVVAAGVAALLAVVAVVLAEESSVQQLVTKAVAGAVALGVAGYAARQSARHRSREEEARRLEMDLVAFPPFIAELPEDMRSEARSALITTIFGRASGRRADESAGHLTSDSVSVLNGVADAFLKFSKR